MANNGQQTLETLHKLELKGYILPTMLQSLTQELCNTHLGTLKIRVDSDERTIGLPVAAENGKIRLGDVKNIEIASVIKDDNNSIEITYME